MEPNDPQLRNLLHEWEVPGAPPSLEERVLGKPGPWWRFLFTGYIRVPVPVGIATALALVLLTVFFLRGRGATSDSQAGVTVNLKDFRPVNEVKIRMIRGNYAN
jgi:hypothetical protein